MRTISIESNGRIEKTAIYVNGEQVSGIRELLVSIDEEGTFNTIISFEDQTGIIHTKNLFTDDLSLLRRKDASFTIEDSLQLKVFTIESDGDLENTSLYMNDEFIEGVFSILIHLKANSHKQKQTFLSSLFNNKQLASEIYFQTEIVYRNSDDSHSIESIF